MAPRIDIYFFLLNNIFYLNYIKCATFYHIYSKIYYTSGVTHLLTHNEPFIEKNTLKYQFTLVDFHVSFY